MCFLREPWLRERRRGGVPRRGPRARSAGATCPHDVAALGSTATASMPRIAQLVLAPSDAAGRRAARAPRPPARRGGRRASTSRRSRSARSRTRRSAPRPSSPSSTPTSRDPALGGVVGDLPPALLDQHRAELGAGAAVPAALPQRRDQHDRGQRRLDGGARAGPWARARASRRRSTGPAPTRRCSTTRSSSLVRAGRRRPRGGDDARAARLAERPADRRRGAGDAPLPRDARRAVGRACRARLHRRRRRAARRSTATGCARCASPSASDGLVDGRLRGGRDPAARGRRRSGAARLGPGQLLSIDPERGLLFDGELKRELARRRPYARWVDGRASSAREQGAPGRGARGRTSSPRHVAARLHARGAEPDAAPDRADAATTPSTRWATTRRSRRSPAAARPLASYFRQRFAQVTNPAIDHYRERTVMSVATLVGPRAPLDAEGPLAPLDVLPVVPRHARRARRRSTPLRVDATFAADEGLGRAVDRVADACADAGRGGRDAALPLRRATREATGRRSRRCSRSRPSHDRLVERGPAHALRRSSSRRDEPRDTHMVATLARLRRRRRLPAARARDGRAARRERQGRRRPADARRGAAPAARTRSRTACSR